MHLHIDQTSVSQQLYVPAIQTARSRSTRLFAHPIPQPWVAPKSARERRFPRNTHPPAKPLLERLPRPARKRLQQNVELGVGSARTSATMNPRPEPETVGAHIRHRDPRATALANVAPQMSEAFVAKRHRRPHWRRALRERVPQRLVTLRASASTPRRHPLPPARAIPRSSTAMNQCWPGPGTTDRFGVAHGIQPPRT
jgi:hypothetical protein